MKWLSYSWAVVSGVLTLGIASMVIGRFDAPFERTALCVLVLVYASIESSALVRGFVLIGQGRIDLVRFMELLRACQTITD